MATYDGSAVAAIAARQAVLATQQRAAAEADEQMAEMLHAAHAATVGSVERLDTIAAEVDAAATLRAGFAVDTPLGAREFQKYLIAKQRDVFAVVAEMHERDRADAERIEALRPAYAAPPNED